MRLSSLGSTITVVTCFDDIEDGDKTACNTVGDATTVGDTVSNDIEAVSYTHLTLPTNREV